MSEESSYRKLTSVLIHVLVWAVFGLFFYYQAFFSDVDLTYHFWVKQSVALISLVVAFYLNSNFLVPRFLFRRKTILYILATAMLILVIAVINKATERQLIILELSESPHLRRLQAPGFMRPADPFDARNGIRIGTRDIFILVISALVVGISTAITVIQKWQKDNQHREELEKDKVSSELSLLKAQINPHFFFNTLNNIYALTTLDPKLAGEAIHQLSKMMRYLLYDTQAGDTMLGQEIAFVKNYISLMQLRLTNVVTITFDTPERIQDLKIAPMIFLPFVENAFKHGVSTTKKSYINVSISQKGKEVDLVVSNSIIKDNSVSLDTSNGIGLTNTQRRLDLLYPGRYKLDIVETNSGSQYNVHLVLDLS